jgi:hypothetical protein
MLELYLSDYPLEKTLLYASTILKDTRIQEVGKIDYARSLNIKSLRLNLLISSVPIDFIISYMDEFGKKDTLVPYELWDLTENLIKKYKESVNNV